MRTKSPLLQHILSQTRRGNEVNNPRPARIPAEEESIKKSNFLNSELPNILLMGATAGTLDKSEETTRRFANFKTQYAVLSIAHKKLHLSGPVKNQASSLLKTPLQANLLHL